MKGKYDYLRGQYPEYVSLEQLTKICGIAKRTASYLVTHGIIPADDSGQRTWRYRIAISDVITYLRRREQVGSMVPYGSQSSAANKKRREYNALLEMAEGLGNEMLRERFAVMLKDMPDVISVDDASKAVGLVKETLNRAIRKGILKHIVVGRYYLIPKVCLIEYMASPAYLNARSNSETFMKVIYRVLDGNK